jgi:hypothetical protein
MRVLKSSKIEKFNNIGYALNTFEYKSRTIFAECTQIGFYSSIKVTLEINPTRKVELLVWMHLDPFNNCQLASLSGAGAFVQNFNNFVAEVDKKEETKQSIIAALFEFSGKSTLILDITSNVEDQVTKFFESAKNVERVGRYKNKNTGTNLVTLLVR